MNTSQQSPFPSIIKKISSPEIVLWHQFKAGDESAYIIIYQKNFRILYRYGIKVSNDPEMVKDCIQDLFVDLWNNKKQLSDTDSITFYLWASLKRKIHKVLIKEGQESKAVMEKMAENQEGDIQEEMIMGELAFEQRQRITKAMLQLSKRQQEAIQLKFYQNLSNEEIAQKMYIKVEGVYNLISKALSFFRKALFLLLLIFCP